MANMLFANNANTTLASSLTSGATSMSVTSATGFPSPTGVQYFYCTLADAATQTTIEIVKVTAVTGTTFAITRGQDGTTGTAFAAGAVVSLRLVRASLNDFPKLDETNTFNADQAISGQLTSSAGLATTGTFTATAPSDGLVMDYATGFGRFSAFAGDGFQWYNAGIANTKLMQLSSSGVITTATWNGATVGTGYGGTGLTSFTSGGVVYASSTSALTTGSALNFNGTQLGVGAANPGYALYVNGTNPQIYLADASGTYYIRLLANNTYAYTGIDYKTLLTFGDAGVERMRISSSGGVSIGNTTDPGAGNLRFNTTNSNGIYFGSSSILTDYEEGTWTPTLTAASGTITSQTTSGTYVKVGKVVTCTFKAAITGGTITAISGIVGFPFTSQNAASPAVGVCREYNATGLLWDVLGGQNTTGFGLVNYANNNAAVNTYAWAGSITYITA